MRGKRAREPVIPGLGQAGESLAQTALGGWRQRDRDQEQRAQQSCREKPPQGAALMEQVDLTGALLGPKEMCFWRLLAARKVIFHFFPAAEGGTAGAHIEALSGCLCVHQLQRLWMHHRSLQGVSAAPDPGLSCGGILWLSLRGLWRMEQPQTGLSVHIPQCLVQRERLHPPWTEPRAAGGNPWLQQSSVSHPGQAQGTVLWVAGLQGRGSPLHNLQSGRGGTGDAVAAAVPCVSLHKTMPCPAGGPSSI